MSPLWHPEFGGGLLRFWKKCDTHIHRTTEQCVQNFTLTDSHVLSTARGTDDRHLAEVLENG